VIPNVSRAFSTHSAAKYAAFEEFGENGPFWRRKILKEFGSSGDFAPETKPFSLKPRANLYLTTRSSMQPKPHAGQDRNTRIPP
jgi:hypothetical protein